MLLFTSLLFGCLTGGITWNVYRVFSSVPIQDRSLLDRPPKGFILGWPLITCYVHYLGGLTTENYRLGTSLRLTRAGVEYSLNADQYFAGKVLCAFFTFLVSFLVLLSIFPSLAYYSVLLSIGGFMYPDLWLREVTEKRQKQILRVLPSYLDIIILSIEAGTNLTGGITHAVQKSSESPLRTELSRVLRDIRSGKKRSTSLKELSERAGIQPLTNVINSMVQAENSGSSLGKVLRAQADQLRTTRFLKAEKLAMEAPVKLLGPLVIFIFPTVFLVLGFVILSEALETKIITWSPLVWAYSWPG